MPAKHTIALVALLSLPASVVACGDPADAESSSESADALSTAIPRGHFSVDRAPSSGSYIADLTIKAGKKFDLEYVQVSTHSEPWAWNPWLTVPTTKKDSMLLSGTYLTYAGAHGARTISFDFSEGAIDHAIFEYEVDGDTLRLTGIGEPAFDLVKSDAAPPATDARVVTCKGRNWDAKFSFADAGRRRGAMTVKRHTNPEGNPPPNGTVTVVYTGSTGVDDYMGFEGTDSAGGRYEFAFKRSELDQTSGTTSELGLGYSQPDASYFMHTTLACTVASN